MGRVFDIGEPRRSHVDNVRTLRPAVATNPRHPSLQPVVMYDQETDANAADRCVLLTQPEARAIATLLRTARAHLPSPRACDDAIQLLTGHR